MRILLPLILLGGLAGAHAARGPATPVLARYIAAVGGEEALRNVETRVTSLQAAASSFTSVRVTVFSCSRISRATPGALR